MELKQYLKMSQQLVMTPQLQQAIKLLQLSRMELEETVQQELLENPMLEAGDPDGPTGDVAEAERRAESDGWDSEPRGEAEAGGGDEGGGEREPRELDGGGEYEAGGGEYDGGGGEYDGGAEPAARIETGEVAAPEGERKADDFDWERFVDDYAEYSSNPGGAEIRLNDDEMPTLEQTLASKPSLADHLEWQLGLMTMTDEERLIALEIVGNVTADGYVPAEVLVQIAEELKIELADIEIVLTEIVQQLDPIGVAARNLKECLLLQARHFYPKDDFIHAILERHLEHLEKKNIAPILKELDCDVEDLSAAMRLIRELEPKPGRNFASSGEEAQYVTPDVYVVKIGDEYVVQLNEDGLPKLKISNFYQTALKGSTGAGKKKEKEFIQDKFKSAVWLIRSIHQRQNTIRKVTESIVRFQREFLDLGVEFLRPLILRDVADDIGMHESTISRVTTNKYVHTPQGIFELKYFFNSRIQSSQGGDLASESVKQKIKKHIGEEDPKKPLSDQKLCEMLEAEGMTIARRTVAKYREMMNIAPSSQRKQVY